MTTPDPPQPYAIGTTAAAHPDKPAVVHGETGAVVTYRELEERSRRISALLASLGLATGDRIAVLMENGERFFEVVWAARRSGLLVVPVNWHLTASETAAIVEDSGARVLFASPGVGPVAAEVASSTPSLRRFAVGGAIPGFADLDTSLDLLAADAEPMDELEGSTMFYSSGTTGRPKGIVRRLTGDRYGAVSPFPPSMEAQFRFSRDMVYLCPAPLYHAGPMGWSLMAQAYGGTVVVMPRFDATRALELIDAHGVTHAQFVPTMFVRMLKLPAEQREAYDLGSLQIAAHAAAPCPIEVKQRMLDWWGDVIWEFYGGSESNGGCMVGPQEWRVRPGTVGRASFGEVRILDDDDEEVPTGEVGTVYFSGTPAFEYHNDPAKTAEAFSRQGWSTLGDLGHVDADGYVYLSERRTNLVISGGVNIYPREVEDVLVTHPAVGDVAVIGVPSEDLGEVVLAVVQPVDPDAAGPELEAELIAHCRGRLATYKCPRRVDFDPELPRLPTGKLLKRVLVERYR